MGDIVGQKRQATVCFGGVSHSGYHRHWPAHVWPAVQEQGPKRIIRCGRFALPPVVSIVPMSSCSPSSHVISSS